jgi:cyclopropane fatty-acyl-phospholipid synthase-like methyltransferase
MNTDTEQAAEQATEPRWKHQLTGGSRKGIPNRQTVAIKDAIERAFDRLGGVSYLEHVGKTDPRTFCALLSRLLPTKLSNADGSPLLAALTELTDAQLEARTARALQDAQRAGLMAPPEAASSAAVLEVQAEVVGPLQGQTEVESL